MYLQVTNLKKSYGSGESRVSVLNGITMGVERGQMCVIQGSSGSGKSTLLNCIGGLDEIDAGSVRVEGKEISGLKAGALSDYRRDNLGFVFQFYNLVPDLTVRENIQVCQYLSKQPLDINELLETLGLFDQRDKFPSQLSGGQQQRCAIARALIKNPRLLLCDEPTGALDSRSSRMLLTQMTKLNEKEGATIMMVTHDSMAASYCQRILFIKDGHIFDELVKGADDRKAFYGKILNVVALLGGDSNEDL